jgi:membrane dipeptidase
MKRTCPYKALLITAIIINTSQGAKADMPNSIIADLHCDTAINLADGHGIGSRSKGSHVTPTKLRQGNVRLQVYACWISPKYRHRKAWDRTIKLIAAVKKEIKDHPDELMLVTNKSTWLECRRSNKTCVVLAVEGGHALDGDIKLLDSLYDQGVRILTLTWNNNNAFASSAYSVHKTGIDRGLTPLGKKLIARADQIGMHIDLSHSSEKTFWDVLEISKLPPFLSHSCVKYLNEHFRNADDWQIRALAQRKGLMGINFCPAFLGKKHKTVSVESVADQFEYVKELAGSEILAIGSDFDGIRETPEGLDGPDKFPSLLKSLKDKGFSRSELEDIGLNNVLRFMKWQ